jgi:hypothetical protein
VSADTGDFALRGEDLFDLREGFLAMVDLRFKISAVPWTIGLLYRGMKHRQGTVQLTPITAMALSIRALQVSPVIVENHCLFRCAHLQQPNLRDNALGWCYVI